MIALCSMQSHYTCTILGQSAGRATFDSWLQSFPPHEALEKNQRSGRRAYAHLSTSSQTLRRHTPESFHVADF